MRRSDDELTARIRKECAFAGGDIATLETASASALEIGLKGLIDTEAVRGTAKCTWRGLRERVENGRNGSGLCHGYRVVRGPIKPDGELERGLREIDPVQANVVVRIFGMFAEGHSPIAIARRLNEEAVPGPRGGLWSEGAIRGHARVGTGILRNRQHIGELVWNRRRWLKDPETSRRVPRQNDEQDTVIWAGRMPCLKARRRRPLAPTRQSAPLWRALRPPGWSA